MEDQLDELVCAGVNPLMVPMIADQPTVEDVLETLLVFKKAVYYRRWAVSYTHLRAHET